MVGPQQNNSDAFLQSLQNPLYQTNNDQFVSSLIDTENQNLEGSAQTIVGDNTGRSMD